MIKEYDGYLFDDKGNFYNRKMKQLKIRLNSKNNNKADIKINGATVNAGRYFYAAFHEEFNIEDTDMCISFKDGDKSNLCIDNLMCVHRTKIHKPDERKRKCKVNPEIEQEIKNKYKKTFAGLYAIDENYKLHLLANISCKYKVTIGKLKSIIESKGI